LIAALRAAIPPSLPRRKPKAFLRGPLDKARKSGKILKQKGWWVSLERFTSIILSFTPLESPYRKHSRQDIACAV